MPATDPAPLTDAVVDAWVTPDGDRIVVRMARGTVCCDPLVGQLLDAATPPPCDPAGGLRPSRHYLLDVDGRDHIVLVASRLDAKGGEAAIALARCVRLDGSRDAAPSLVVATGLRGRGIGTRLLATLWTVARRQGVERFHGDMAALGVPAPYALRRVGTAMHDISP